MVANERGATPSSLGLGTGDRTPLVAIIGGGFSGICLAAHLHRQSSRPVHVIVIERGALGQGTAYRTDNSAHLLNGPAGNLSAFEEHPDDFVDFLVRDQCAGQFIDPNAPIHRQFIPRLIYRRYLLRIIDEMRKPSSVGTNVSFVHSEVIDISSSAKAVVLTLSNGQSIRAHHAVLAVGHPPAKAFAPNLDRRLFIDDPWDEAAIGVIARNAPVAVIGSGQTASDMVLGLTAQGHVGPITLLSRRGLIAHPYVHVDHPITLDRRDLPDRIIPLLRWIRKRCAETMAAGGDWRAVINALRPHTHAVWYDLPPADKRAFLEHLAPYWHIHRTRLPPSTAVQLEELRRCDRVRVVAGRIVSMRAWHDGVEIGIRQRSGQIEETLSVSAVIGCTGLDWDIRAPQNPLIAHLISSGMARWDEVQMGFDVTPNGIPLGADGKPSQRVFAIGPICKGKLLEIFAIRDIRVQCGRLAAVLLRDDAADGPQDLCYADTKPAERLTHSVP